MAKYNNKSFDSPGSAMRADEKAVGNPVAELYGALTGQLEHSDAVHYGLWGPETGTHQEGMDRANQTLVRDLVLEPGRHFLDAGCGVGSTAVWLAEQYAVRVTGLTICEPHIQIAKQLAKDRGVGHLVEFEFGDFMNMSYPDAFFDAVLNQETFNYANDKSAYLKGVYRVLKPGGRWQAVEGLLTGAPMSEFQQDLHARVQRWWETPPLEPVQKVLEVMAEVGFEQESSLSLDTEVQPFTKAIRDAWILISLFGRGAEHMNPALCNFMEASVAYDQGLREEVFTYQLVQGVKPA